MAAPPPRDRYDAVIVGAGLGGLLSAAHVAKRGGKALVLERLPFVGGRFTTVPQDGYQITTGALHLVPHGSGGALGQLVDGLGIQFNAVPQDIIGSFFFRGRHVVWRKPWDILALLGVRGKLDLLRIVSKLKFNAASRAEAELSFREWVRTQTADATIDRIFDRFAEFAVGIGIAQLSYREMRAVFRSLSRFGLPAFPEGGCRSLIGKLEAYVRARGGEIATSSDVVEIVIDEEGRASGVRFRNRRTHRETTAFAGIVVSDIGPRATARLLGDQFKDALKVPANIPEARGLKLHIVSEKSLIQHRGIMFCLDTQRISGIVQVSNAVPSVVPDGLHMLDTFQVLATSDIAAERSRALADLRYVFGSDFDRYCSVVRSSAFRQAWPVNRLVQGGDLRNQQPIPGLLMVGDGYKPSGYMMVEGVAASVRNVASNLSK